MAEDDTHESQLENDDERSDEDEVDETRFLLGTFDWEVVRAVKAMLWNVVRRGRVTPCQLVSIGKALYALERLPKVTEDIDVVIDLTTPVKLCDDQEIRRFYGVRLNATEMEITSSGHVYDPQVGGDTFSVFPWFAAAGYEPTHRSNLDQLWMVPVPLDEFPAEANSLDPSQEGFRIHVMDDSGDLEMEEAASEESDDG